MDTEYTFQDVIYNEDDRAQRLLDIYNNVNGQINISHVNSVSHVVAWHKHDIQTDYWFCIKGSFKVGLASPVYNLNFQGEVLGEDGKVENLALDEYSYNVEFEYLSDKYPRMLKIPPGIYHGYKALEPNSILLYYLSEKYNPKDEIRKKVGEFGEDWGTENK
tara:strand:- start:10185 stop:10670 length:486 start_codon:yes stop_codon:yes gene_type:complete